MCPDRLRSLPTKWGPALETVSRAGLVGCKGSGSARLVVQLRDQKRLRVRRHDAPCDDARPQLYGRGADKRRAHGHDLEIVVQVLAQAVP